MKSMTRPKVFFAVSLLSALLLSVSITAPAQSPPPPEIVKLNPPQPVEDDGKIEVLEFFAYGCIHCYHLEAPLAKWVAALPADVKFRRMPAGVGFEFRGIDSAVLFYTLEAIGALDKVHANALRAANADGVVLGNPTVLKEWLTKQGVDVVKFDAAKTSFSVQSKITAARRATISYGLTGTPFIVVNGRVGVLLIGTPERMLSIVDNEIRIARATAAIAASATKSPPATTAPKP